MSVRKTVAIGIAALVLGLAIGGVTSASAATETPAAVKTAAAGACGMGLRLGSAMRDSGARLADVVASLTGMSVEDVRAARASGSTFEKIAADSGVSADEVVTKALDVRRDLLAAKVKDGTITQAQADTALKNMETRMTERMSSTQPGCDGTGGGGPAGGGMGRGRGSGRQGGCGGACAQPPTQ